MPIGKCTMKANIVIQSNIKQEQNYKDGMKMKLKLQSNIIVHINIAQDVTQYI